MWWSEYLERFCSVGDSDGALADRLGIGGSHDSAADTHHHRDLEERMKRDCPCKDCEERHLACHDTCGEYKDWRHEKDLDNAARRSTWQEGIKYSHSQMKRIKGRR